MIKAGLQGKRLTAGWNSDLLEDILTGNKPHVHPIVLGHQCVKST